MPSGRHERRSPRRRRRSAARAPASAAKLAPADWLIIGEPLDGADAQQGQLLDNMLRAIGVTRSAPMRERRATFVAVAAATPRVEPQDGDEIATAIATVAPRCIVALGRAAAAAVLGNDAPIGHWRGRRHERAGVPVVVTFSPAFLLRHPKKRPRRGPICASPSRRSLRRWRDGRAARAPPPQAGSALLGRTLPAAAGSPGARARP